MTGEPHHAWERPRASVPCRRVRRAIAAIGRTLVTVGLLILLFVAYQLWGTGIFTARAQDDLRSEFEAARAASTTTTTIDHRRRPPPATDDAHDGHRPGAAGPRRGRRRSGTIEIPKIGVDKIFVEGTGRDDLKKGPGHYPGTPLPGPDRQRRDRRPPHDVRPAVLRPRRARSRATRSSSTTLAGTYTYEVTEQADRRSPTDVVRRRQHARRAAHAHHLQPEVLGARTARHQGEARCRPSRRRPVDAAALRRRRRRPAQPTLAEGLDGETQAARPGVRLGRIVAAGRPRVVVGVPPVAAPARRGSPASSRSSSCSSRSTSSSNASCPRATRSPADVRRRATPPRTRIAPFVHRTPVLHEHDARRVGRRATCS